MKAPAFWSQPDNPLGRVLDPLGRLVSAITLKRMDGVGARMGVPVICVGNPTVGGAGKTPVVATIARRLNASGRAVSILARGYGGALRGPVRVEPARHGATDVGDEALLHARVTPTIIARDRVQGAILAEAGGAEIIVMDDGFQSPALAKDLSLLVVDGAVGLGNGRVLPAGPLRAAFAPQLARADALVVMGQGPAGDVLSAMARASGKPVLKARLAPQPQVASALVGRDVLAFCGIGRPMKFVETLGAIGTRNAVLRPFADHHAYSEADAVRLLTEADATGLTLVTTEKDAVKLVGGPERLRLAARTLVLPVQAVFKDEGMLDELLAQLLAGSV